MSTNFGLPELIIVFAIVLITVASRKAATVVQFQRGGSGQFFPHGTSLSRFFAGPASVADIRYAHAPSSGTAAELFGVGSHGVRWRQVAVLLVGAWMSGSTPSWSAGIVTSDAFVIVIVLAWPFFFVFSAIAALRSFQSGLAVACFAALMYSALMTSLRLAMFDSGWSMTIEGDYWMKAAAGSFLSVFLTMSSIQFALAGRSIWRRMAGALFATSLLESYTIRGIYLDDWSAEAAITALTFSYAAHAISAIMLTATFWLGTHVARVNERSWTAARAVGA